MGRKPVELPPAFADAIENGVQRAILAQVLGVPGTLIDSWRQRGCPQLPAGRYRIADVVAWLRTEADIEAAREHVGADVDNALARWRELRADREQLALQRDRGELLPRDQVHAAWSSRVLSARMALLALPRAIAGRIGTAATPALVEAAATDIVHELLLAFAADGTATPVPSAVVQPVTAAELAAAAAVQAEPAGGSA